MTDSRLHVYNSQHHDCQTMGELHGLADAMRGELLSRIDLLEEERDEAMATMYHERGDKEQAEEELAERDRMLRLAIDDMNFGSNRRKKYETDLWELAYAEKPIVIGDGDGYNNHDSECCCPSCQRSALADYPEG